MFPWVSPDVYPILTGATFAAIDEALLLDQLPADLRPLNLLCPVEDRKTDWPALELRHRHTHRPLPMLPPRSLSHTMLPKRRKERRAITQLLALPRLAYTCIVYMHIYRLHA